MSYEQGDRRRREVDVHRAGAIGDLHVPAFVITGQEEMPEQASLRDARQLYADEGAAIAQTLIHCLPGGTLDQVLLRLLEHAASLLRVSCERPTQGAKR